MTDDNNPDLEVPTRTGFLVTDRIDGASPRNPNYPLLKDDLLIWDPVTDTYTKEAPGMTITGLILAPEERESLRPIEFRNYGLSYDTLGVEVDWGVFS